MSDANGRLLATMLEVALTESADQERMRRGRRYARQGAVIDLDVQPGVLTASVQGSRAEPYRVVVRVPAADARLVPSRREMAFDCSCPDWESPCKHGVAAVVRLAEQILQEPELLQIWRGDAAPDIDAGAEMPGAEISELAHFLGLDTNATRREPPTLTALPHVQLAWDEPWSVMLHDALRVLSGKRT